MPRLRTTKKLAQRIDLNYFARPHPLRRARFLLSAVVPLAALLWLSWHGLRHSRRPYSAGPMASVHDVFGLDCTACHVIEAGKFRLEAADDACLACHDGPIHHAEQKFTPRCQDCHVEHRGRRMLAQTHDVACSQCHAQLETNRGVPHFVSNIRGFNTLHPEFAPLRPGFVDPGTIKLNHAVHLKHGLRGPDGRPLELTCSDCHRPAAIQVGWRYALVGLQATSPVVLAGGGSPQPSWPPLPFRGSQAYMAAVEYAKACAACHPLLFDQRFVDAVPHDKPEVVHKFVVEKFADYIARHPGELLDVSAPPLLPERPLPRRRALSPGEWVNERVDEAEQLLWGKTCKECHSLSAPRFKAGQEAASPVVAPAKTTLRWLPHAMFDHQAHQMLACTACHTAAQTSQATTEVLLPGIETCRECHHAGPKAAESRCFECHTYHDWSKQRAVSGRYTIPQLLGGSAAEPAPPPHAPLR